MRRPNMKLEMAVISSKIIPINIPVLQLMNFMSRYMIFDSW